MGLVNLWSLNRWGQYPASITRQYDVRPASSTPAAPPPNERLAIMAENVVALILGVLLLCYLCYALLRPEQF